MSQACIAGEDPRLDLVQSYAVHQCCPGFTYRQDREEPEPCTCPHHAMAAGPPRRKQARPARVVLTLAAAVAFLALLVALLR